MLAALAKPEVGALVRQYLPVEQLALVVVGDARALAALRRPGYPAEGLAEAPASVQPKAELVLSHPAKAKNQPRKSGLRYP